MRVRELLAFIMVLLMAMPVTAQDPVVLAANTAGGMQVEDLRVTVGKSLVIDYPADISRISTSNPDVVDAVPATSREFLLHGKGHGAATVVVWAKTGLRTMYNVTVEHNLDPIKRLLKDTFPNENIGLVAGRDSVTLIGTVSHKDVIDRAVAIVTPLAKTVVSNLSLPVAPVSKQIVLKVRFAELDRTAAQQFGVNLISTGAGNTPGTISTQQFGSPQVNPESGRVSIGDALNIFAFRKDLNLGALVKALQAQGVLQILAEPNLVTTNGREASFLVGGEFPVPVLQGGSNAGAVTIQFREFGIRLLFNPLITENGTIKLYVKPEVSTIDLANAVTFSGFTIPALATRRMETNIELGFGQSFVIAGLIDDRVTEQFNKLPGLANIPILGTLFRSRTENRSKSELVIIVTPEVATPINSSDPKPEPAWLRDFMPQKRPGDKVGTDLVPGTNGATVPPLVPGRTQIDHESIGNGAKTHPVLQYQGMPKSKATGKPMSENKAQDSGKTEAAEGKRSGLKLFGRGKGSKAEPKAESLKIRPVGDRPLAPPVESSRGVAPTPAAEAKPAIVPSAPVEAKPVEAIPEARTVPAVLPEAAPANPAPAQPGPAELAPQATNSPVETKPAEAKPSEVKPTEEKQTEEKPGEVRPTEVKPTEARPVEAKPDAVASLPVRRGGAAGITSLPLQVLGQSPVAKPGSASGTPSSGEQQ
ncbi:MAG: pilus assembly protein N-terminal domain-containing protein [Bryobacteraceae bacterium]|nr:pilus assembly protein N-terminal domain-containing protein [Bryobacteraceae bacterium]